jgi:cytochrome c oxidase subunit 2
MDSILAFSITKFLGQPEAASHHAGQIDHMNEVVHWFMLVLFVGWSLFFLVTLLKFHRRANPQASYRGITSHFSTHLEILVVLVEVVLLLGFAYRLWAERVDDMPSASEPNVVRVRAVAQQFQWSFHYAGDDGLFGLVRPDRIDSGNPVGLVKEDPSSKDDFLSPELMLPKGRKVVIQVTSKDVIHNLCLTPMRIQQDAIPGMEIPMWFVPTKTGRWDIVCAQLCGAAHAKMVAKLKCVDEAEYNDWAAGRSKSAKAAAVAMVQN